jgi:hypothetical protein
LWKIEIPAWSWNPSNSENADILAAANSSPSLTSSPDNNNGAVANDLHSNGDSPSSATLDGEGSPLGGAGEDARGEADDKEASPKSVAKLFDEWSGVSAF